MYKKNRSIILLSFFLSFFFAVIAWGSPGTDSTRNSAYATQAQTHTSPAKPNVWDFPNLHPLVVHFPIVLLVFAAFLQLLSFWRKDLNMAVLILLVCGTAGAWLAADIFDAHPAKTISAEARQIFHVHHQFADYTTWLSTVALVFKLLTFFVKKQRILFEAITLAVLAASATTVCISGHYGSALVHIEGIGPKGNGLRN